MRESFAGDERLRVVRHGKNRGIAAAMNTLMREARGELVATLGDDDVNEPDRIRRQVEVFDLLVAGDPQDCLRLTAAAAERAGVDLDGAADVTLLVSPVPADRDSDLHAAMDAYISLHAGADGHARTAAALGNSVVAPEASELTAALRRSKPQRLKGSDPLSRGRLDFAA